MPNRIIKESIKHSDQIDKLTWFEEAMWYRLMVTVDDYGCYDGRVVLLKNELFPTKEDVKKSDVENALRKMELIGLIQRYEVDGHPYIFLKTWSKHQRVRDSVRKYPEPTENTGLPQVAADCGELPQVAEKSCRNPNPILIQSNPNPIHISAADCGRSMDDPVDGSTLSEPIKDKVHEWLQYKRERKDKYTATGLRTLIKTVGRCEQDYGAAAVIDAIDTAMASGWAGMALDRLKQRGVKRQNRKAAEDALMKIIQEET